MLSDSGSKYYRLVRCFEEVGLGEGERGYGEGVCILHVKRGMKNNVTSILPIFMDADKRVFRKYFFFVILCIRAYIVGTEAILINYHKI